MVKRIKKKIEDNKLIKSLFKGIGYTLILFIGSIIIGTIQYILECIWLPLGLIFIFTILAIVFSYIIYSIEK